MARARKPKIVHRGDVWWVTLPKDAKGNEFSDGVKGEHPFLILSSPDTTSFGLCIGIPATGNAPREDMPDFKYKHVVPPDCLVVRPGDSPLSLDTCFCCEQLRVVSVERLNRRAGKLKGAGLDHLAQIEVIVRKLLGLFRP